MKEDIRQLVLYQKYSPEDWWTYISIIDADCLQTPAIHNCSQESIERLGIDFDQFSKKVNDTYTKNGNDNFLLKVEEEEYTKRGHINFPGIIINDMAYRVSLFQKKLN